MQPYADLTWIRESGHLEYVDGNIAAILGWTAEEIKAGPLTKFMTEASYDQLKNVYLAGEPDTVAHRHMTLDMLHKDDGHTVPMHVSVVCHWDGDGELIRACGSVHNHQRQREQDELLAWWPRADPEQLETIIHLVHTYAAL